MEDKRNEEVVMHHVKDYFTEIPQTEFSDFGEALASLIKYKQENPREVCMLCRWNGDNEEEVSLYCSLCSNLPLISVSSSDGEYVETYLDPEKVLHLMDHPEKFISEVTSKINEICSDDPAKVWRLNFWDFEEVTEIYLVIDSSEVENALKVMDEFNRDVAANGYQGLSFNKELCAITGELKPKAVKGGFFEKRRIKKENQFYDDRFALFISLVKTYLRKY